MSYKINQTNGNLLVDLIDGRIDNTSTDLVLIGRNFTGYGELFNENFVKLLENFASVSPPSNPLRGQLWYDTSDGRLKVWNGEVFRSTDTTIVSAIEPNLLAGDIWIDTRRQQLYFNDGSGTHLAGPIFSRAQGATGFRVDTLVDRFGNPKTVAKLIVNNTELALISRDSFETSENQPGFGRLIQEGITINQNRSNFEFRGITTSARQIIDKNGDVFSSENILRRDDDNTTNGFFHISNDNGITIGRNLSYRIRTQTSPRIVTSEVQSNNADYRIQVNRNNITTEALRIDTEQKRIGIWNSSPEASLDVNGDLRISGNLTVLGETTTVETATLRVEDKNIELNFSTDSTLPADLEADGGGITLLSSQGNKTIEWLSTTNSWTFNTNLNIKDSFSYKINGNSILTSDTLYQITNAPSLKKIGKLDNLEVANFSFTNSTISLPSLLYISTVGGTLSILNRRVSNLNDPVNPLDSANKRYVDQEIDDRVSSEPVYLEIDVTGIDCEEINEYVVSTLNSMLPWMIGFELNPLRKKLGTRAIVKLIAFSAEIVGGNISLQKENINDEYRVYHLFDQEGTGVWSFLANGLDVLTL